MQSGADSLLVGASGSGKTSLLKLMRGDLRPAQTESAHGGRNRPETAFAAVTWDFGDGPTRSPITAKRRIGFVSADLLRHVRRVGWDAPAWVAVASGLVDSLFIQNPHALFPDPDAVREKALHALAAVGLADKAHIPFDELSQGQAIRTLLARALLPRPKLLLLDELFEGLDPAARRRVAKALATYRFDRDDPPTCVLSGHRPAEAPDWFGRVVELDAGRIVNDGPRAALKQPANAPAPKKPTAPQLEPLLEFVAADVHYDEQPVLRGIDFSLRPGEAVALLGLNGSGKSTLMKAAAGTLDAAFGGRILRFGQGVPVDLVALKRRIGYVAPDREATWRTEALGRDAACSGFTGLLGSVGGTVEPSPEALAAAFALLERLDLTRLWDEPLANLSRGEPAGLFLVSALAPRPELLLLDEPLAGLDAARKSIARDLIDEAVERGAGLLYVGHHPAEFPASVTRGVLLEAGTIRFDGPLAQALARFEASSANEAACEA